MAFSNQRETSDGTLALLDISIEYFDRSEIAVLIGGVAVAEGSGWSWVGLVDAKISFSPAIPLGVEVQVIRSTDLAEIRHSLLGGAAFTDQTLDENFIQILHIAQEAKELASLSELFNDLNLHGYKIINVAAGVDPGDAVNFGQLSVHNGVIIGYRDAAAASAATAAASAAAALISETNAAGAVTTALIAHVAAADPHTQYALESAIGTTIQPYDANAAKTNAAQSWTATQRTVELTDNDGSFDLNAAIDFKCATAAGFALTFTNIPATPNVQKGTIVLINSANHPISAHANTKVGANVLSTISATGTYELAYRTSNGVVYITTSGALSWVHS